MKAKRCLNRLISAFLLLSWRKKATFIGDNCSIGRKASIILSDGSSAKDIVKGGDAEIHGCLYSQSKGKIHIGSFCKIGYHTTIRSVESVTLVDCVVLAEGVIITDNNTHPTVPLFNGIVQKRLPTRIFTCGNIQHTFLSLFMIMFGLENLPEYVRGLRLDRTQ